DLVAGGPPCQGFSTAGQRNVMDPRNSLVFEFARIIIEIQPKTMVFENVPGLVSMTTPEGIPVLDALCRVFEDGGFGAYEALRNSLLTSSGMGLASKNASGVKQLRKGRKGGNADDQDDDEFADDPAPQMEMAL
ncbi:MAG: DNA cytosine methyltransferase, partial [Cyanobacteria bacterium REEB65]|nr:DNA cytosine methyltransferase [Cyanobacteria bacterium REEB65]